ncbi:phospho-N-acetylmuramoyl-pentapeptide-transferase [Candidatus Omnitrophota bacterium]
MLYYLLYPLKEFFVGFNVFRYITFRASMAAMTTFLLSVIVGPFIIRKLCRCGVGQQVRKEDSRHLYELHKDKQGTPTMGGLIILLCIFTAVLLWADIKNIYIQMTLFVSMWLGLLGFCDDYIKIAKQRSKGLTARAKIFWQTLLGLIIGAMLYLNPEFSTQLDVPFAKHLVLDLGIFFVLYVIIVLLGSSNAVNLTDGLDGLAIGCVIAVALALGILSYVSGHIKLSDYLLIPYIADVGELAVFCSAIVGAGLGFLWFNCHPAEVFMGDVGSLSLGGMLGIIAVFINKGLLLVIMGGIFVVEALSVILQVASFKLRKKRIFKIAPLHHHFQFLGWSESKVIIRFWIVALLLAMVTLITLKLR